MFGKLFSLQLEEDVNEVIFALNSEGSGPTDFDSSPEAYSKLKKLLNVKNPEMNTTIIDSANKIKPLDT